MHLREKDIKQPHPNLANLQKQVVFHFSCIPIPFSYMNSLFLPIFMLLTTTSVAQVNQPNPDSSRAVNAPTPFTHADTIRALHNLFKSKRSTAGWLAYGSAGAIAVVGLGTLADNNGRGHSGYYNPNAQEAPLLFGILSAPFWVPGTVTLIRFTKKREQKAMEESERTNQIPPNLRKKKAVFQHQLPISQAQLN